MHNGMHISQFMVNFNMMMSMRVCVCVLEAKNTQNSLTYSIDQNNGTLTNTMDGIRLSGILISLHYTHFQTKQIDIT